MSILRDKTAGLMPSLPLTAARSLAPVLAALAFAVVLQLFIRPLMGDFTSKLLIDIGINVVLAVSLTMVNGFTGQFSIGHAAFMMVGGYTAAMIVYYGSFRFFGDPYVHGGLISSMIPGREAPLVTWADAVFLGSLLAGGVTAAVCGYVVGLPSLRLRGDYLAIVTLGFGEIVRVLIQSQTAENISEGTPVTQEHLDLVPAWRGVIDVDDYLTAEQIAQLPPHLWPKYVGGALGFSGLPFYTSLFWVFAAVALTLLVAFRLKESAMGRAFLSIREDEIASEAMGVDTTKFKVRAFVVAAFFAGIAGGLFAHNVGVQLNPGELGFQKSFDIIIMVVLGGLGSISGATIAAAIVTLLPEALRNPEPLLAAWPWVLGFTLVCAAAAIPAHATGRRHQPFTRGAIAGVIIILLGFMIRWAASRGVNLGDYRMIFFALALIIMMILRPQGLFGVREVWEKAWWRGLARSFSKPAARGKVPGVPGGPGEAGGPP